MEKKHIKTIADEMTLQSWQVEATAALIDDGATVPFIARYRKERTGVLDEVEVSKIRDRLSQLEELDKRKEVILRSLSEREKLTEELQGKIAAAETLTVLEDIYLPYRPKRRTRATIAKEKGLEPLAVQIFEQADLDPDALAGSFLDTEKGVESAADALAGARDIVAEWVNEDQTARARMRQVFSGKGVFISKVISGKEEAGAKYKDYFDWQVPVSRAPSHRILAMRRGEKEGILSLRIVPPEEEAIGVLEALFLKGTGACSEQVRAALQDSYKRLLSHAMETEIRLETKMRADEEAIRVFAKNLRQLLMTPPLGQRRTLGIDPGIRTGCKWVCLDRQGKLLHNGTVYPLRSEREKIQAGKVIEELCARFHVEAVAVGNGTGGRETEALIRGLSLPQDPEVVVVNESGASVYSASEAARREFPDHDVTVRGAVSIGRRLMDPLAELVKIDPKSIGVGQYQHDVDQRRLKGGLDDVVMSCVNAVGVEVNTASVQLLTYVSGLGPRLAENIVAYREDNGPFSSRGSLRDVPRLGAKAFEQAAGFLRVRGGDHPLDESAVHPESYEIVEAMARDLGCSIQELMGQGSLRESIEKESYVTDTVGLPTLDDILRELAKPGRDPREAFDPVVFSDQVREIGDLTAGMKLPGLVTNVTAFGAFVDIGVHQDGLVHISQLADHFIRDPNDEVKVQDKVLVTVLDVDLDRNRISLSRKEEGQAKKKSGKRASAKKAVKNPRAKSSNVFNNPFHDALKGKPNQGNRR